MTFVELCAGSAAVSLRWLRRGAKPPLAYQGGKRGYADGHAFPRAEVLAVAERWRAARRSKSRISPRICRLTGPVLVLTTEQP